MNDKIKELQKQIRREEEKINNCSHDFGEPYSDPETIREAYGYETFAQGSDIWSRPTGYRDVKKQRWARKCKSCGFIEYTYKQKPIIKGYEPDF
jgi:hypothetical protein